MKQQTPKPIDYIAKMKGWTFMRENDAKVYTAESLNYLSKGTQERLTEMEVSETINVYGNNVKRTK